MEHDYKEQRRDTFDTFRKSKGLKLPERASVEYAFFADENDCDFGAFEKALKAKGFRTSRLPEDKSTVLATIGPIVISAEEIWFFEEMATKIALPLDFYPDGWELAD